MTRWREDGTSEALGSFVYLREPTTGKSWSVAYQPTLVAVDDYQAIFSEGRAEFRRSDDEIEVHTELAVAAGIDAELRRITIVNRSSRTREIEVTTYAEVVLSSLAADQAHPAFNKLFVETETVPKLSGILCRRRAREVGEETPWLGHAVVVHDSPECQTTFETDRALFIGRNHNLKAPVALEVALSGSAGAVLDPVMSVRKRIAIKAGATVTLSAILGVASDRDSAIKLLGCIQEQAFVASTLELASAKDCRMLQQIKSNSDEAGLFDQLLSPLMYGGPKFRTLPSVVKGNVRSQSGLWGYRISGDLPIVLLHLATLERLSLLDQALRAHAYWQRKGFAVDLVIWNEDKSGSPQSLHDAILKSVAAAEATDLLDKPGGIFVHRADQMPEEDRHLVQSVARVVLSDEDGSLEEQIKAKGDGKPSLPRPFECQGGLASTAEFPQEWATGAASVLTHANEFGGFSADGREYVMHLQAGQRTPAPWVNVMANPDFGTLVTESGAAFTWSENAREHRLTPWSNDPVIDPSGEICYIRDELSGEVWSPTPAPVPGDAAYTVTHGFGYTTFHSGAYGLTTELVQFVAHDAPVKFFLLKVTNPSEKPRRLSATLYLELVLGDERPKSKSFIVTESALSGDSPGSMYARNVYSSDFSGRTSFLTATEPAQSVTGDRREFLGRNRPLSHPAAMARAGLSGHVGALLDPCMAMQVGLDLAPGETRELAFVFGCAKSADEARSLTKRFSVSSECVHAALTSVRDNWSNILANVQIETPEPSLDVLGNGWLLYQTISSRIWGRTSFYQPGGAYGFRDQLQDVMALVYAAPAVARDHILRSAQHQFVEGDVQHWWHPPSGKGVRTRISDDYLWLPYVTSQYVLITGDYGILDEQASFLEAAPLKEGEDSNYGLPATSATHESLYEHCVRALKRSLPLGTHGLPLMGAGDWNDGMNLVGIHGKGESVWLAFFLYDTLQRFARVAKQRGDEVLASQWESHAELLKKNCDAKAWDGDWYVRAYFDDGSPLGVSTNAECCIDSLPQSWAVLSGAGKPERNLKAMASVYKHLVREESGLVLLLEPPFDKADPTPGYIAGYLAGVRENGGQYTHAAMWVIMALAELGDYDRAMHLLMMINPLRRGESSDLIHHYKVEPYVLAGDVYSNPAHVGRGGWTWYSGSAAWYYRVILETILGFELRGAQLKLAPKIPDDWLGFKIKFSYKSSAYSLSVQRHEGEESSQAIWVDDVALVGETIPLKDDGQGHQIRVQFAASKRDVVDPVHEGGTEKPAKKQQGVTESTLAHVEA